MLFTQLDLLSSPTQRFAARDEVERHVAEADESAQRLATWEEDTERLFWIMPGLGEAWNVEVDEEDRAFVLERASLRSLVKFSRNVREDLLRDLADAAYQYWYAESGDWSAAEAAEHDLAKSRDLQTLALAVMRSSTDDFIHGARVPKVRAIDHALQWQMDQVKQELAFLADLRARNLREEFGDERGAQARMAEVLEISPATVSTILSGADGREQALRDLAAKVAADYDNEEN